MKKAQVESKYLEGVAEPEKTQIFKNFESEVKVSDDNKRVLVVRISTSNPDRSKDTVQPDGMQYDHFMKNPVVLFAHKYDTKPIAKCISLKVDKKGVTATVEFTPEGLYKEADIIYQMYKEGFLNAWSIGFMPVKGGYEDNEFGGYNFKQWELFEFSSVPVPDNPEALTIMRSKGINVDALLEKKEEVKDEHKEEDSSLSKAENSPETKSEEPNEEGTKEPIVDQPKEEQPAFTDETKLTDLTVAQLKGLFAPAEVEKKDVAQVTSLAYVLSDLNWLAYYFANSEVSQTTIDKINQAISILLEAIKEQAELGKKEVAITQEAFDKLTPEQKETVKGILTKAGRVISAKNEEKLKTACDYLKQASAQVEEILGALEETEEPVEDDKSTPVPFRKRLLAQIENTQKQTAKADKEIGLTLRLLKQVGKGVKN